VVAVAARAPSSGSVAVPLVLVNADEMTLSGLLKQVDAVTVRVPDLRSGLLFYVDRLGHRLKWRNDATGQVGLLLPHGDTELVLTTEQGYEPNWLVDSVDAAVETFRSSGGAVVAEPFDIPVGRGAVVRDPFGNVLVLVDLSRGVYSTDEHGQVTGVVPGTDAAPVSHKRRVVAESAHQLPSGAAAQLAGREPPAG
jgi:predicted enzyme related to lactoylglutathione lyase